MKIRRNVYKLSAGDPTLHWYSKAVEKMKTLPPTNPRSWYYQAAMHGFNPNLPAWNGVAPLPSPQEQQTYWNQCQHGSWFFLPWHRMYLAYFEQIVASVIIELGGPENWALPYWNYSDLTNPHALDLPPAFAAPANKTNPLWVAGRYTAPIPQSFVSLHALNTIPFSGNGIQSPLGFGGPVTGFSHGGGTHGALESVPHDVVHMAIGGIMGDPRTAALDPIFWLHHANIDRLWQVWLNLGQGRANPSEKQWLKYDFDFHDAQGRPVELACGQVLDTRHVLSGYEYEDVPVTIQEGLSFAAAREAVEVSLEVVAASNESQLLGNSPLSLALTLNPPKRKKTSFMSLNASPQKSKHTVLHFENITGKGLAPVYDVYLNAPDNSGQKDSYYAGSLAFFGLEEASTPGAHGPGSGQHIALDITELISSLRGRTGWNDNKLTVRLEPTATTSSDASVKIGRISLYSA